MFKLPFEIFYYVHNCIVKQYPRNYTYKLFFPLSQYIVDTPGFGDSDNDDNNLINEMVDVLKDVVKTANGFVLLFNGMSERFDTKAQQMLREFEVTHM